MEKTRAQILMYTQSISLGNRLRNSESCIQECPWEQHVGRGRKRVEESKTGQREKLNCGSVTRGADADPIRNSSSQMDLQRRSNCRHRCWAFVPWHYPVIHQDEGV